MASGKPPATPQELRVNVIIYRRVVSGVDEGTGQPIYTYAKRRGALVKQARQKSSMGVNEHMATSPYSTYWVGNWWNWLDVKDTDVVLRCGDEVKFGLNGPPVNWEGRNRWAIIELTSSGECVTPGDDCPCQTDPESLVPPGTAEVHAELAEDP